MMGDLAGQDSYYDPMTGIPMGSSPPAADPREGLPLWARQADVHPQSYQPVVGMWPTPRPSRQLPDVGPPAINLGSDVAADVADNAKIAALTVPQSPLDLGLMLATGPGRMAYKMGSLAAGAALDPSEAEAGVRDPRLWHGISSVKLSRPLAEMSPFYSREGAIAEKLIKPADLEGGWLMPALGDRSMAGGKLLGLEGKPFNAPVWLEGGHAFMPANVDTGSAWASDLPVITRLANKTKKLAETGDVYFPYTTMGEQSVDFSHHVSDTLAEMLKQQGVSKKAAKEFDAKMKVAQGTDYPAVANWPGVNTEWLDAYMRTQPGVVRNKVAKIMDSRAMQDLGFPEVAQARYAITDPRLLDAPTGAGGLSISKLDPEGRVITRPEVPHQTYSTHLGGQYVGGFGKSVPKDVLYPDMVEAYSKLGYPAWRHDYLMSRGVEGAPVAQRATPQWVDTVSKYLGY